MTHRLLDEALKLLLDQEETWKANHDFAVLSQDLEEAVALALHLIGRLLQADERNQFRAFQEAISAEEADRRRALIEDQFRSLMPALEGLLVAVQTCQERGYAVAGQEDLTERTHAVRGLLTPDEAFFAGEAQETLREQALAEARRGDVVEMREIDD